MAEDLRFGSAFLQQPVSCEPAFSSGHDLVSLSRCRAAAADEQEPTSRAPVSHDQQGSNAMSRGFPSMTALLGLLAVAGYQHRDKIAEMLGSIGQSTSGGAGPNGIGGLLGQLSRGLGGASAGGLLSGGIGELLESFKQSGDGETVESWVGTGPTNQSPRLSSNRRSAQRC